MFPIRCFNCGKVINNLYNKYLELLKTMTIKEALDKLEIKRQCCRVIFMTNVDLYEKFEDYDVKKQKYKHLQ